ncbi:MAG: hypothetical protein C4321_00340, partial [Chloroflexota bacterium]
RRKERLARQSRFEQAMSALTDAGWSIARIAQEVGVSHSTAWNWKHGRTLPVDDHVRALLRIARTIQCS